MRLDLSCLALADPQFVLPDHIGMPLIKRLRLHPRPRKVGNMSLGLVLVIILVIFLLGGFSGRFGGYGYGFGPSQTSWIPAG
jgi:hypothetical protein